MNDVHPPPAPSQGRGYVSPTERVKSWAEGPILHIRFSNPAKHNALSVEMWEAVPTVLARAERVDAVRVVVFSGEGGKSLLSGGEISVFDDLGALRGGVGR